VGGCQQELQRRWQYLAEAQSLSHSGIFAWEAGSNTLEWSDETYNAGQRGSKRSAAFVMSVSMMQC
jgi:hypothetical protein